MSTEIYTCVEDDDVQKAARIMEEHRIRRLMVQDSYGNFVGVLALADLARHVESGQLGAEILEQISQPVTKAASSLTN
jgi:CBS domain-containing protein